jgi:hypothetical protein
MSGDSEYALKEVIEELKHSVFNLTETVNGLRISLGTEYAKKTDCVECKHDDKKYKEINDTAHGMLINWIIGAYVYATTVMGIITAYWSQKQ